MFKLHINYSLTDRECDTGQVRLVDGHVDNEGSVEICYNGTWGGVCGIFWGNSDANVVCRQLGFSDKCKLVYIFHRCHLHSRKLFHTVSKGYRYGHLVTETVHLKIIRCTGEEESLFQCSHDGVGNHDCGHSGGVQVQCYAGKGFLHSCDKEQHIVWQTLCNQEGYLFIDGRGSYSPTNFFRHPFTFPNSLLLP